MKNFPIVSLIFFLLIGCGKKNTPGQDVLPMKKMETVLWDMMRADQFVTLYLLPYDTTLKKDKEHKKWQEKVLALHKITEQDFQNSFHYYKKHPELLQQMLDTISLSKRYEPAPINRYPKSGPPAPVDTTVVDSIKRQTDSTKPVRLKKDLKLIPQQ